MLYFPTQLTVVQLLPGELLSLVDNASRHFYVRFCYGGHAFKRSLGTSNEKLARAGWPH
jgi:hypothetical protein